MRAQGGGRCGSLVLADDLRWETSSFTPPASLQRTQRVRAAFASKSARLPPQLVHLSGFLWSLANPLRSSCEPRQAEPPAHPHAASTATSRADSASTLPVRSEYGR